VKVPDRCVTDLRERGYFVFEGLLGADELTAAQDALWLHYPTPAQYFTEPGAHAWLAENQFAGIIRGPWRSWDLNRLVFHRDLLDLATRFFGSDDLRLYEAELWAKYAGAVDYEQRHHRDYVNHSLVVPKRSNPATQIESIILISDVGEGDGPTNVVPLPAGDNVPYWPKSLDDPAFDVVATYLPAGAFADEEVSITGAAGTLFTYRTDLLHRGSRITGERAARFTLLTNYDVWAPRWTGRVAWAERALHRDWREVIERATPRERTVFGFPAPGDAYWDEQTLADTQARYPGADMTPYR